MRERWVKDKRPKQKQIDDNARYVGRFIELYGDLPVDQITAKRVRAFSDTLLDVFQSYDPASDLRHRVRSGRLEPSAIVFMMIYADRIVQIVSGTRLDPIQGLGSRMEYIRNVRYR
jgi:hypothetical protein